MAEASPQLALSGPLTILEALRAEMDLFIRVGHPASPLRVERWRDEVSAAIAASKKPVAKKES